MSLSRPALWNERCFLISQQRRLYALSRFPTKRAAGPGRSRENVNPKNSSSSQQPIQGKIPLENIPSDSESRLWHTSQRPPTSNPEEGLRRLLMENETLIVERQMEMLNIFVGFEQCNKYTISNEEGQPLGFIAEEDRGFLGTVARQAFATHRPFRAIVLDSSGSPILWLRRPFAWINSRMYVQRLKDFSNYTPEGEPVLDTLGEAQQVWHPWRRRYDLFLREGTERVLSLASGPQSEPETAVFSQVAKIDAPFLAWDFRLQDGYDQDIAFISRAFGGFGREIFTDTGRYSISFKPVAALPGGQGYVPQSTSRVLSLDERALFLALAINIDADYFSRHSHMGGGGLFHFLPWE
ncbi:hypothetical protein Agabi119p4_3175 [Agaricus bisporus var. burnettii]|uniref:Phospholipid scramblase n=1 Tax=Agaricus bisporus var. burnettii TaxID=192524 RepID=A0A8H7F6Y7_AGABI|nr:hypothetical protein Agabi119p4_3175 [Agaricus bisporus var. burnettii]